MDVDELKEDFGKLRDELRQQRDELRVRIHLAGAEAKEQWEVIEKKWSRFEAKSNQVLDEAKDASGDIADATKLLGSEIKEGYKRLRRVL